MDRDDISGISKEFEQVLNQMASSREAFGKKDREEEGREEKADSAKAGQVKVGQVKAVQVKVVPVKDGRAKDDSVKAVRAKDDPLQDIRESEGSSHLKQAWRRDFFGEAEADYDLETEFAADGYGGMELDPEGEYEQYGEEDLQGEDERYSGEELKGEYEQYGGEDLPEEYEQYDGEDPREEYERYGEEASQGIHGRYGGPDSEENYGRYSGQESDEDYGRYSGRDQKGEGKDGRGRGFGTGSLGFLRPSDGLIAAFFIPVIIMVVIFAQRGIFPFGQESFLRTDMYHQYAPFFSEFQDKLQHGGSLLYSWDIGLGVNFAALYAYYLASPLNWLLILCPKELIIEFMTYSIVLKIGLCGLTFAYYLKQHNKGMRFGAGFFGIFYAMSGYIAAYSWNIMWLDCILLFPLIMLGIERLVKEKKGLLYCVTLGLSILSNYYISIMICIFMVIYFIALQILEGRRRLKDYFINILQFGVYSLLAGALAGLVLLPEISALQSTASGNFSFPQTYEAYFSIIDMLARHIGNVATETGLKHWPNIYCGVAVYLFFLLYLMCRRIPAKEKAVNCGLLLIFLASFSINVLNFIWHGFHYPNSLPGRQSFIYIFLLLSMCYRAYLYLDETPKKQIAAAFGGSVFFVLLLQKLITDDAYHFIVFYVAILFLGLYTAVIYFYKNPARSKSLAVLLALGIVAVEAAVNMTVTSVSTTSRTAYKEDNKDVIALMKNLSSPNGFYRVDKVNAKTKNDGAWMNFPSVSLFSSLANADVTEFFKAMGCEGSTNAYSINGSTPLVDSLFSVQYALYKGKQENPELSLKRFSGDTYLYKNPYTLPLGFMVPDKMEEDWQYDMSSPVDVQNSLAEVLGAPQILSELYSESSGRTFTFTPQEDGEYYVYVMNKKVKSVSVTIADESRTFDNINRGFFVELGYLKAGVPVKVENRDDSEALDARAYLFETKSMKAVYDTLNAHPFIVTKWMDDALSGEVEAGDGGTMFLSIPYDKGWSVTVDGKAVTGRKLFGAFTAVDVGPGRHTVAMKYMPDGLKTGAILSAAAVLLLIIIAAAGRLLPKKKRKTPYDRLDEEWHGGPEG